MSSIPTYTTAREVIGHYIDLVLTAPLDEIDFTYITEKPEETRRLAYKHIPDDPDSHKCYTIVLEAVINYCYFNYEDLGHIDIKDIVAAAIDAWNETIKTELTKGFVILDDGSDMLTFLAGICLDIVEKLEKIVEKKHVLKYTYVIKLTDGISGDSTTVFSSSPTYEIQMWFYETPEMEMFDARG